MNSNLYIKNNEKLIIITQYYKVENKERQKEIDTCLQLNCKNVFIDEIHLLVEEIYNLEFIDNTLILKIKQINIGKRLAYNDVFNYYNNNISNNICILLNSDIYLDNSIELLKYVNFNENIVLLLNRYEYDNTKSLYLLNGLEANDYKRTNYKFLEPYQETIWAQDCWIFKTKHIKINEDANFYLGVMGCDNYIAYLFYQNNYIILNPSKLISINHYDLLSIDDSFVDCGIIKGGFSKDKGRVENMGKYIFLNNIDDIPDMYTYNIKNIDNMQNLYIKDINIESFKIPIVIKDENINISSFNIGNDKTNLSFENEGYWKPLIDDTLPYIEYIFEEITTLVTLDLKGKKCDRYHTHYGFIDQLEIKYIDENNKLITYPKIFIIDNKINGNFIKRIYFEYPIKCKNLKLYPTEENNDIYLQVKLYTLKNKI